MDYDKLYKQLIEGEQTRTPEQAVQEYRQKALQYFAEEKINPTASQIKDYIAVQLSQDVDFQLGYDDALDIVNKVMNECKVSDFNSLLSECRGESINEDSNLCPNCKHLLKNKDKTEGSCSNCGETLDESINEIKVYTPEEKEQIDAYWMKMSPELRKKALRDTGSWVDDADKPISQMGGSEQDVMEDYIAKKIGIKLHSNESINEALPETEEDRKKRLNPQQGMGNEVPPTDTENNPADEGEAIPDETVNPETGEEDSEVPMEDGVPPEPDMAGPSGMGGGAGSGDKKEEPAIDPTEVKTTPSSGQEKENFGRKGTDEFFYMVTLFNADGVKDDVQILNAADEKLWSAKENGIEDMEDMKTIIRQAADKVEATNVDRGILDKYWFEAEDEENIEKAEKEEQIQKDTEQNTKEAEKPTAGEQPANQPPQTGVTPVGESKVDEAVYDFDEDHIEEILIEVYGWGDGIMSTNNVLNFEKSKYFCKKGFTPKTDEEYADRFNDYMQSQATGMDEAKDIKIISKGQIIEKKLADINFGNIWIVINPQTNESELADICWKIDNVVNLERIIKGSVGPDSSKAENWVIYDNEQEATLDAQKRLSERDNLSRETDEEWGLEEAMNKEDKTKMNESIKPGQEVIYKGKGAAKYTGQKAKVMAVSPDGQFAMLKFADGGVYPQARISNLAFVDVDPKIAQLRNDRANPKPLDNKAEDEIFDLQKQFAMNPKMREAKATYNGHVDKYADGEYYVSYSKSGNPAKIKKFGKGKEGKQAAEKFLAHLGESIDGSKVKVYKGQDGKYYYDVPVEDGKTEKQGPFNTEKEAQEDKKVFLNEGKETMTKKINEQDNGVVEKPTEVAANQKITGEKEEGNTPSAISIVNGVDDDGCKEVKTENDEAPKTEVAVAAVEVTAETPSAEVPEEVKPEENVEKTDETETKEDKQETVVEEGKVPADPAHITDPEKTVQELKEEKAINDFFNLFNGRVVENKVSHNDFNGILKENKEVK